MNFQYNNPTNPILYSEYGFKDKQDINRGGLEINKENNIVVRDNLVFCDTRDCVGTQSLLDTQNTARFRGVRPEYSFSVKTISGTGVIPILVTATAVLETTQIKNGDKISISGVKGNKAANGIWVIGNINYINPTTTTFELNGGLGNGNYTGGGIGIRIADPSWPTINEETSIIEGNEMIVKLPKKLKVIRSLSLIHTIIPRDIIPLLVTLPDFLKFTIFTPQLTSVGPTVRLTSTINIANLLTDMATGVLMDGVEIQEFDRILLKNQTTLSENGVYIAQNTGIAPVRANDMPAGTSVLVVTTYYATVTEGIINTGLTYICSVASGVVGVGNLVFTIINGIPYKWTSYIPQEAKFTEIRSVGFYSTPLDLFRTYINGSFSLPNKYTPPPLKLWNPVVGGVNHQLAPYPNQTVPTYTTANFSVPSRTGNFYLILSGYGVYDLNDWTYRLNTDNISNALTTDIARKLLMLAIVSNQSYRDEDKVNLILSASFVTDINDSVGFYGYGVAQRFVPGPGLGMHYQPGTKDGADPTVTSVESPIPFPNFRGNVWGPYNSPGDRFQRLGLRDTLQDLYLNGDTNNIFGTSIIKEWVSIEYFPTDPTFGLYYASLIPLTFGSLRQATNTNITNAMRIVPNGYGALSVNALGGGETYTKSFLTSGGQGPDVNGVPINGYSVSGGGGSWVDYEIIDGGTGQFGDELGAGTNYSPDSTATPPTMKVENTDSNYIGNDTDPRINRRIAWYDLGPNSENFINQMDKFKNWAITELPDTNIIISIFQAERDQRVQSTNQTTSPCILSCPIRLNLGSTSGTQEYVENIQSLLSNSSEFWENRYVTPLQSLHKLSINFTTYEGLPINLEKMLQPRRSLVLLQTFTKIFGNDAISVLGPFNLSDNALSFLFDPLDSRLIGREKRNLSLIFKIQTYEYESPGLYLSIVKDMLATDPSNRKNNPFIDKKSIFNQY